MGGNKKRELKQIGGMYNDLMDDLNRRLRSTNAPTDLPEPDGGLRPHRGLRNAIGKYS